MSLPPLLAGAALAFWGWESGNLLVAAPLALAVEAPRWTRLRFELDSTDYARVADLCTVFFVGLAILLAADRGVAHGVIGAFSWLPPVLAPILIVQRLGALGRVPLTALFRYLRKQKERDPSTHVPLVDTGGVFVALCVIAAGVGNAETRTYFAGAVLLAAWALFSIRPRRERLAAWALLLATGVGLGFAGHTGMAQLQAWIGGLIAEWHMQRLANELTRSETDIGTLGRLKLRNTIMARVTGDPGDVRRARLLHRASYNAYIGTTWIGRRATAPRELTAGEGGTTWTLAPGAAVGRVGIAARVERERTALSLPGEVTRLKGLAVTGLTQNGLGIVQAASEGDWMQFEAEFGASITQYAAPVPEDSALPPAEIVAFARIADQLGLHGMTAEQAARRILAHLGGFSYSLWRDKPPPAGMTPLADFMVNTRSGHCEYFAAAATLLLRAAGVPARYATGYAVMEYSALEQAWVVRARHAHAWTRAWIGGRWIDLDPTPPDWFGEEESRLAPLWEDVADLFRWGAYRWSQREEFRANDAWWGVLIVLVAILAWRLLRGKRMTAGAAPQPALKNYPGRDSEFYELVRPLPPRDEGETLSAWLARVAPGRYDEALRLHLRYRFDPLGLSGDERARLRALCVAR
jgi:hypothetical protein